MFSFDAPIGELLWRAVIVYGALLCVMRLAGRRTVGQFTPFDLLVVMLVSEVAGSALVGSDGSVAGALLVCVALIGLNAVVGILTARVRAAERLLEGEAILLGRDGRVFETRRKRHRIAQNDIDKVLREADCDLADVDALFLEVDGSLTIRRKR